VSFRTIDGEQKEALRRSILEVGFHKVGFTDSSVLQKEREFLAERGAGPFEPTQLPPRTDPKLLLKSARSVIVVALSYSHPDEEKPPGLRGRLSKYCRGLDYHDLMMDRLESVASEITNRYGGESLCFVDTGPPLERAFAEKAGLGRLGKNTNLIIPKLGSWVFLGVLITDLEILPDQPAEYSICGSCRLCLDACPTKCLTDWVLDSENCLGYLNQKYDDVPLEHRRAMGDWLFGCDICQDVCPHNVKAVSGLVPEFSPLALPGAFPDLRQMLEMSEQEFQAWFGPTAADWRGSQTIKRNALVALGNSANAEAEVLIEPWLDSTDPLLREHAEWAARELG
jgi:epoxyqueuosine reductase